MYKEDLLNEIEKLEEELNVSSKKTYIINSRLKRLIIFLKNYNSEVRSNGLDDLIEKLSLCDKTGGYGERGGFDKHQYLNLLKDTKNILEQS